jgi:alcohol dehydrogenase (cytochrome c)
MGPPTRCYRLRRTQRAQRILLTLCIGTTLWFQADAQISPTFTAVQADRGKAAYAESCARCHGPRLAGGEAVPPLTGYPFLVRWAGHPAGELFAKMQSSMPPGGAGTLADSVYADIMAYLFEAGGIPAGSEALPVSRTALDAIEIPGKRSLELLESGEMFASGGLAPGVILPQWTERPAPQKQLTPVTEAILQNPPAADWLSWRRTRDAVGFSPLEQITPANVQRLRMAWTLALPAGPTQITPLVHDGVMFVTGSGDHFFALDAATGDQLWHYKRGLPAGVGASLQRNIALYEDKIYFGTSDVAVVALEAKTGKVLWEQSIGNPKDSTTNGGPLVAQGVVLQGLQGAGRPGGQEIVGLDATTGVVLWHFKTIAQPGDPNANSWNGISLENRTGGSVWTSGSYDATHHLAFFGPAPTYDTGPLRNRVNQPGTTNDALYTDATVALDPLTGKLAWYYQHMPNDQWDLDWAFERQIIDLPVNGKDRKVLITAGKPAVYDALDAATGQYLFSIDLGVQNFITHIDPKTGAKTIDPSRIPGSGQRMTVCPHQNGGKSWLPASYDPDRRILYTYVNEACMDFLPTPPGEIGPLTTNVWWTLRPPPGSDGQYGRLQAIDLVTRRTVWTLRQRAPITTGVLATAGGVVFVGGLDRWFNAYEASTGKQLWRARLNEIPNTAPISYMVRGKQYIAIVVARDSGPIRSLSLLTPENALPVTSSSSVMSVTLWAFELLQ